MDKNMPTTADINYFLFGIKKEYTGPAEVRLGFHPVESLGCLAQPDALSSFHPPLKVLIIFHQDCVFGEKKSLTFHQCFRSGSGCNLVSGSGTRQAKLFPSKRKT